MRCANCDAPITANFCATCGQRTRVQKLSVRHLVATTLGELTSFEQPLLRTLRGLLLHPGRVVTDYVAGRRVRYTNPIKWALVCATLMFLVSRATGARGPTRIRITSGEEAPAVRALLDLVASNAAPLFVLTVLPVLALALRICLQRTGRTYAEQLVLVFYTYGTGALLLTLYAPLTLLTDLPSDGAAVLPVVWTAWAAVTLHRPRRAWTTVLLVLLAHMLWVVLFLLLLVVAILLADAFT